MALAFHYACRRISCPFSGKTNRHIREAHQRLQYKHLHFSAHLYPCFWFLYYQGSAVYIFPQGWIGGSIALWRLILFIYFTDEVD